MQVLSGYLGYLGSDIWDTWGQSKNTCNNQQRRHSYLSYDERIAVVFHENPVRMLNGMEPRYTYTKEGMTINIITGEKKPGLLTFSQTDPTILVRP